MTCEFQERVSLHVCGDAADPGVEAHLAGCPACCELAEGLLSDSALLRTLPLLPAGALQRLEAAVLPGRAWRKPLWWGGVGAVAAAAAVVLLTVIPRNTPVAPLPPPAAPMVAVRIPPESPQILPAPQAVPVARPRRSRPPARFQPVEGSFAFTIKTSDPGVVILMVADEEPATTTIPITTSSGEKGL